MIEIPPGSEGPGLYIHVPFCRAICPYCDFAVTLGDAEKRRAFCDRLATEVEFVGATERWPEFDTVYFGGGTPSALTVGELERILGTVRDRLSVAAEAAVFLEANPEDVTAEGAGCWRALGVGFLSLGVQSFDRERLRFLGRAHDEGRARAAVRLARDAGFDTVSIDLIFGLPGDTAEAWSRDLEIAIELGVDHVSCYQLTIHSGTAFGSRAAKGELAELDGDRQADLYKLTHERLGGAGFEAYEVSNFARAPEHRSRHNQKYWHHVPYLGLGPSAHSFDGTRRWWNRRGIGAWSAAVGRGDRPSDESEELTSGQLLLERLLLGLRTRDGVDLAALEVEYGIAVRAPASIVIESLARRGLLTVAGDRAAPTPRGMAVADALAREVSASIVA